MTHSRLTLLIAPPALAPSAASAQPCGNPWSAGPAGPSPRWRPSVAYDSTRGKVVVFGGIASSPNNFLSDTWEWTAPGPGGGGAGPHQSVTGPGARYGAGMAYDSARHVTVLFGGGVSGFSNQTWEWNGVSWTQAQPLVSPPATGEGSLLAYDAARARVVLVTMQSNSG